MTPQIPLAGANSRTGRMNCALFVFICSVIEFSGFCEAACGVPYFKPFLPKSSGQNRILNGIEARKHSHPWQALVYVQFGKYKKKCGGSLIDWGSTNASDLVLTAAHCLMDSAVLDAKYELIGEIKFYYKRWRQKDKYVGVPLVNASQVHVLLGVHDVNVADENVQKLAVVGLAVADYHQYSDREDVALLKLERKVGYNEFIQGICLPSPKERLPAKEHPCYVTGWGFLNANKTQGKRLQQIEVHIFKNSKCIWLPDIKRSFCAGSETENIGTCSGDSGGPLTCQKDGKFVLYGVVSFSATPICSSKEDPTVFAKVTAVLKWMEKGRRELLNDTATCSAIQLSGFCEAICGEPYFKPILLAKTFAHNRIRNGIEARRHSHPWQAFVRVRFGKFRKECGGSLIDWGSSNASDLVLTAAHCLMDRGKYVGVPLANPSHVRVYLGVHEIHVPSENMKKLPVIGLAIGHYHQYSRREDIALLKLKRKVGYNKYIQGICLPSPEEDLPGQELPCYVTGWGFLDDGSKRTTLKAQLELNKSFVPRNALYPRQQWRSECAVGNMTVENKLQQIEVQVFKNSKCTPQMDRKTMFCAGSKTENVGACVGDSGGPLSCQKDGKFILYGVVSFTMARICSTMEHPTVFAKVPAFLKWMEKEISEFSRDTENLKIH
ncbi:hypothetical protein M514_03144 [Trichuris suis]|uniref:Peptidase S1 domain-containing protein n=1 Tax=Trichuris suis TaxID=68888 RepID=A0A085N926_9BILA|nr:hypothetical protein M514_03144 [Trichuris suis]